MATIILPAAPARPELNLPEIRRRKGISLERIAAASKINIRYLQAIEEGHFDKLPGGIFNTSYIRQYARAIEYEENALLAYYAACCGGT
jgi:cytoskeletal protein RodZ